MTPDEITDQILGAWEDYEETPDEEEPATEPVTEPDETDEDETEEEDEKKDEDEDLVGQTVEEEQPDEEGEEEAEEGEEGGEEEGEEQPAHETDDIEVKAFLAKYDNDVDKALKAGADLYHVVGRQGHENRGLKERVTELEGELERTRFASAGPPLTDEQRTWIDEAVQSGQTAAYVQQALDVGEFDLARALCREWAREDPFSANRAGQVVDQVEAQIATYVPPWDLGELLDRMKDAYPDMAQHSEQMTVLIANLGENHPAVVEARSADINTAARGIFRIYELARASTATVRSAKQKVKDKQRQDGVDARNGAVVSSATTSPSATEKPRTVRLGPGLTLEQLEAEFAKQ